MTDEQQRDIARHMRRYAPDCTYADIAISLGVSEQQVRDWAGNVRAEVQSKVRHWRRAVGALAERLHEDAGLRYSDIAGIAGISRQHLVTCRNEVERGQ